MAISGNQRQSVAFRRNPSQSPRSPRRVAGGAASHWTRFPPSTSRSAQALASTTLNETISRNQLASTTLTKICRHAHSHSHSHICRHRPCTLSHSVAIMEAICGTHLHRCSRVRYEDVHAKQRLHTIPGARRRPGQNAHQHLRYPHFRVCRGFEEQARRSCMQRPDGMQSVAVGTWREKSNCRLHLRPSRCSPSCSCLPSVCPAADLSTAQSARPRLGGGAVPPVSAFRVSA